MPGKFESSNCCRDNDLIKTSKRFCNMDEQQFISKSFISKSLVSRYMN